MRWEWLAACVASGQQTNLRHAGAAEGDAETAEATRAWRAFQGLDGWVNFGNYDFNLDKTQDLLFYKTGAEALAVKIFCRQPEERAWYGCADLSLPIAGEPQFIRAIQHDAGLGFVAVTAQKLSCVLQSFVPSDAAGYVLAWQHADGVDCDFQPLLLDLNFDGLTDVITMAPGDARVAFLNLGAGLFDFKAWNDLNGVFDLDSYSTRDKYPLDLFALTPTVEESVWEQPQPQQRESASVWALPTKVYGWLKSLVVSPLSTAEQETASYVRKHLGDFEKHVLQLYTNSGAGAWQPRPLPLRDPSPLSRAVNGFTEVDMDGDCVADLVLIVESPDIENRHELEIWLTEESAEGNGVQRRLWRSQRLLLPEGVKSIAISDFTASAGADLLVLVEESALQFSLLDKTHTRVYLFKMLHEAHSEPENLCSGHHFSYGGLHGRVQPQYMTVSVLQDAQLATDHLFVSDIDGDRFDDLVMVVSRSNVTTANKWALRVMHSLPLKYETETEAVQESVLPRGLIRIVFDQIVAWLTSAFRHAPVAVDPTKGRTFSPWYDLELAVPPTTSASYGWIDSGTFFVWHAAADKGSRVLSAYPQTGYTGERGFFTRTEIYGTQCLAARGKPVPAALPLSGSVVSLAPAGMDGTRHSIRRTLSTIDSTYKLKPMSLTMGFGASSNYIDLINVGVPYTGRAEGVHWCNATRGAPPAPPAPPARLGAFRRTWSAIMPNSELLISVPIDRRATERWRMSLILAPGKQALKVVIVMCCSLALVGLHILSSTNRLKNNSPFV